MYVFDEEIIHDKDAMWGLALSFKAYYGAWAKELQKVNSGESCMNYDGKLIFKRHDEKLFKKAVEDYKHRVKTLENIIKNDLTYETCRYSKYVSGS